MPTVSPQLHLFHGTLASRLPRILAEGLSPTRVSGADKRWTGKADYVYLTDSLAGAIMYASGAHEERQILILEIDVSGLDLEPDYDDADQILGQDLSMVGQTTGWETPALGAEIPEEFVDDVLQAVEDMGADRPLPTALEVVDVHGVPHLYARPVVLMGLHPDAHAEALDFVNDPLVHENGNTYLVHQQYRFRGVIPPERIVAYEVSASEDAVNAPSGRLVKRVDLSIADDAGDFLVRVLRRHVVR